MISSSVFWWAHEHNVEQLIWLFSVMLLTLWNGTRFTLFVGWHFSIIEWCVKSFFESSVDYHKWYTDNSFHCCSNTWNFFCTTLSLCQRFALISFSRKPLKRGRFHLFIYFLLFLVTKWIRTLRKKLFALARVHLMYAQCRMCVCNFVSLAEFNLIGLNSHADSFMFTTRPMLMELYNNFECS